MRKVLLAVVFLLSLICVNQVSAESFSDSPQWVKNLPVAQTSNQLFVVAQVGEKTTAWISFHEKDALGNWRQIMTTPGFIGKNGLGKVREGDNKTRSELL